MNIPTPGSHLDALTMAVRRERELRQVVRAEYAESSFQFAFTCVLCAKERGEQHRHEPDSDLCEICWKKAGMA